MNIAGCSLESKLKNASVGLDVDLALFRRHFMTVERYLYVFVFILYSAYQRHSYLWFYIYIYIYFITVLRNISLFLSFLL